jgi:hypothetical protein
VSTRFYLPASGAAPVTPAAWATGWEKTTGAVWRPCSTTKSNTALADTALVGHTVIGSDVALVGFVTAPLAAGFTTSADTISTVVRGLESNLLYNGILNIMVRADTVTLRFGDPTGTADFALTGDLTTDLCPWVELSANLTFTGAATGPPPADTRRSALRPLLVR